MRKATGDEISFEEAVRYWRNARSTLARCGGESIFYKDMKPVREAFGTAWLAIDMAIKAALKARGVTKIPQSWEALLATAGRHLAIRNGKLVRELVEAHRQIHLEGYYHAALRARPVAVAAMDVSRRVIETLSGRKIG